MDERSFIIDSFRKNFKKYINSNIVIYGLGKNTKAVLEECTEFNIVGLMDGVRTGERVWDIPVISCDEIKIMNISIVVIIATSVNVPIIYRRIADCCESMGINVYDINGELLRNKQSEYSLPFIFQEMTRQKLISKVDEADVVSFDIFDTLLARTVLQPTDVFEIIQRKNKDVLPTGYDFIRNRIKAERNLYLTSNPNIYEIYDFMRKNMDFPDCLVEEFIGKEIEEEKKTLRPRQDIIDILFYAQKKGKEICCTSDMYFPSVVLGEFLHIHGVDAVDEILVSCEQRVSKCNGLFLFLKEKYKGKRILHIGDNHDADIRSAAIDGIDDTFEIASGYHMVQKSAFNFILDNTKTLDERCIIGEFISKILNSPFIFEQTKGKCPITDNYSLGFYFLEPMVQAFLNWMIQQVEQDEIDYLLLGSRDGWLIKELLDIYSVRYKLPFQYTYFYTSRSACTLAGMSTEQDVEYAASLAFDGSTEQMLTTRFLLKNEEIEKRLCNESDALFLGRHIDKILYKAQIYRNQYLQYISTIPNLAGNIGFFDFVSSGTCQLWLEKIMEKKITGYYFARNIDKYKEHLKIKSLLKPKFVYEKQSKLYKDYVFLENILTSPEPTLKYLDEKGRRKFERDCRSQKNIKDLNEIHTGIKEAFEKRCNRNEISGDFAENLIDIIRPEFSLSYVDFFDKNILMDEFCNREFNLKQVLYTGVQ